MHLTDLFAIALWPLVATGVWLIFRFGKSDKRWQAMGLAGAGFLMIFVPPILLLGYFLNWSTLFVFDEYIGVIVLGSTAAIAIRSPKATLGVRLLAGLVGVFLAGYGVWNLVGDFLLSRQTKDGLAHQSFVENVSEFSERYHILINYQDFRTTRVIYQSLKGSVLVRARLGAASNMVLDIEIFPEGSSSVSGNR